MTANRRLIGDRGLSEVEAIKIDLLHEKVEDYMKEALENNYDDDVVRNVLREIEFELQKWWGFPLDEKRHYYFKDYQFKKEWAGRTFVCNETKEQITIPFNVQECDFYQFGSCYIDVGRHGFYSRSSGNFTEIIDEEKQQDS